MEVLSAWGWGCFLCPPGLLYSLRAGTSSQSLSYGSSGWMGPSWGTLLSHPLETLPLPVGSISVCNF